VSIPLAEDVAEFEAMGGWLCSLSATKAISKDESRFAKANPIFEAMGESLHGSGWPLAGNGGTQQILTDRHGHIL
jgi:hypothetical protein